MTVSQALAQRPLPSASPRNLSWQKSRCGYLRENPAVPYDQDEITRVIQDAVDPSIYNEIKDWTVGEFREWILADTTSTDMIRRVSNGLTAEMISAVTKLMSNLDLMYGAKKIPVTAYCNNTIGTAGHIILPQSTQSSHRLA